MMLDDRVVIWRKIQASERAMKSFCGDIIGVSSRLFIVMKSKIDLLFTV